MSIVLGDWGTTRLRLFRVDGERVERRVEGPGIGAVGDGAAAALADALADLGAPASRIVLCGMAGARGALMEAPYAPCPADEAEWAKLATRTEVAGVAVLIAAGLRCANFAGGPDVMRGEETQIFGALHRDASLAAGRRLIVHPGTHSKWALIEAGRVTAFQTFPTGELFALLGKHSTLLRAGTEPGEPGDGFEQGLARVAGETGLIAALFETRAAQLLDGRGAGWASAFLSGLLIGDEVRVGLAMTVPGSEIVLIGDPALTRQYALALGRRGIAARSLEGDDCALAGLSRLAAMTE